MKKLKIGDTLHRIIDGFEVNESSREVKYSNVKIDFTGKSIADLPLKYQECQLVEEVDIEATNGQRIEGTSFQVNSKKNTLSEIEYIKGQTTQSGTPTPSSPQPINVVSGRQVVSVLGKNLFDIDGTYDSGTLDRYNNGFTLIKGTNRVIRFQLPQTLPAGTYTLSYDTINDVHTLSDYFYVSMQYGSSYTNVLSNVIINNTGATFTTTSDFNWLYFFIRGNEDASTTITIDNVQLEKGTQATTYEEYKGNDYEINLGKNLLNLTNGTYGNNGITAEVENGKITLNGTASAVSFINISYNITLEANQSYVLSANNNETIGGTGSQTYASIRLRMSTSDDTATDVLFNVQNNTRVITKTANTTYSYFRIRTGAGLTYNNFVIYPQLEKGDTPTTYAPYKTPIFLGNIGNYLDFIRKGTGKNLFDKDNANILIAYINGSGKISQDVYPTLIYIPCKPNTKYALQKALQPTQTSNRFKVGCCSSIPEIDTQLTKYTILPNGTTETTMIFETDSTANYLVFNFAGGSETEVLNEINTIQIEEGNQATLYEPYDYKDKWYIHKEIERINLTSSMTWYKSGTTSVDKYYTRVGTWDATLNKFSYCNRFKFKSNGVNVGEFDYSQNNTYLALFFCYATYNTSTINDFKTWLDNNDVYCYVPISTPTNTLIEDEELINQLNSIELLEGLNNVMVSSPYLSGIIGLHYNFRNAEYYIDTIYTGYVNNYTLPKMKNKLEYRELDIDLLSPLALATLRTADAVGTYNLQNLIREIIQPLIDDGFTLKELNVGNNQVSVNYLTETIESALNKLSNKFNFWWYIDKNKNIFINDINYLFSKKYKLTYDNDNKINGLIDFTPSMESIDYCNTIDFTNVRLITKSSFTKYYYRLVDEGYMTDYSYYNPIKPIQTIYPGDEIEFDIPFIINTSKRGISETSPSTQDECYFRLYNITPQPETASTYDLLVELKGDNNNQVIIPNNVAISDSFNNDKEFVFVRDNFFSNLIIGMKYNGNSQIDVGIIESDTALMWSKIRINNNKEIEVSKNKISDTGIIERQFDMREMWLTYEELLEISNSLIKKNDVNVEKVELVADIENDLNIGDIINIDKPTFLTTGSFIITDKIRRYYDNVDSWVFRLNNTNILESYVDLFRASEEEEQTDKVFNLITGDYSNEGLNEKYTISIIE